MFEIIFYVCLAQSHEVAVPHAAPQCQEYRHPTKFKTQRRCEAVALHLDEGLNTIIRSKLPAEGAARCVKSEDADKGILGKIPSPGDAAHEDELKKSFPNYYGKQASTVEPGKSTDDHRIKRQSNGDWAVDAKIGDRTIPMLVDTGASTVALTADSARRLGINVDSLRYDIPIMTAGGVIHAASVQLPSISIGGITVTDVEATVVRRGLMHNLLGNNFLSRIGSYEFAGDYLTLRALAK